MVNNSFAKKKVLFILHLPPPIHGAATVSKFLKESRKINEAFEADFINLTTSTNLEYSGKINAAKLFPLLRILNDVFRAIINKKYDLCYVSLNAKGAAFYKDLLIVFILKIFGKNIIYHFHNKGVAIAGHKKLNDLFYRFTFKKTKSILLSKRLYSDLADYVEEKDIFYCANGIPEVNWRITKHAEDGPADGKCQILFLSNMMIEKGIFDLLAACKILKQKDLAFQCHFVGAWSEIKEEDMRERVRLDKLSEIVFLHGKQFGSDKDAFFAKADIFVFPTYYHNECFPLVNLEAMQFSLPVVTTNVGGIPDMVIDNETGFLISPKDVNELSQKLELLILDPKKRRAMGRAGKILYEQAFTLEKFEKNITCILNTAIMDRRS